VDAITGNYKQILQDSEFFFSGHTGVAWSLDGKHIAFTAQFDGNTEVYVMPAEGGPAKRLTYTATLSRDDVSDRMRGVRGAGGRGSMGGRQVAGDQTVCTFSGEVGQEVELEGDCGSVLYDVAHGLSIGKADCGVRIETSRSGWHHCHRG